MRGEQCGDVPDQAGVILAPGNTCLHFSEVSVGETELCVSRGDGKGREIKLVRTTDP